MKNFQKENVFGIVYTIALIGFTVYAVLDTFVISHTYDVVPKSNNNINIAEYDENSTNYLNTVTTIANTQNVTSNEVLNNDVNIVTDGNSIDTTILETTSNDEISKNIENEIVTSEIETTIIEEPIVTEMTMPPNVYASMFTSDGSTIVTDGSYTDGNMAINLSQYREYDSDIYVADIYLSTPSLLKTALANDKFGRYITGATSTIAEEHNAILAINGDYYGSQYDGYVLRNGDLYRSTVVDDNEDLVIMKDGTFQIIKEKEVSAEDLLNSGAQQILAFGPGLLKNGEILIDKDNMSGIAKSNHPRTAIGFVDNLHYMFVVVDGRTDQSQGMTAYELAEFMRNIGVQTAYNLDGGGSSTLYFNGRIINQPTTHGDTIEQRSVSDIVYIGY